MKTAIWIAAVYANTLADYINSTSPKVNAAVVSSPAGHSIWMTDRATGEHGAWLTEDMVKAICDNREQYPDDPYDAYPLIIPTPVNHVDPK